MSFSIRLTDYLFALVDNGLTGSRLPLRDPKRGIHMNARDRAVDWKLQVQDQCQRINKAIREEEHRYQIIEKVEHLLYLLDEDNKDGQKHGH